MTMKLLQVMMTGGAALVISAAAATAQDSSESPDVFAGGDPDFCESCSGGEVEQPVDTSQPVVTPPSPDESGTDGFDPDFIPDGEASEWNWGIISPTEPDSTEYNPELVLNSEAGSLVSGTVQSTTSVPETVQHSGTKDGHGRNCSALPGNDFVVVCQ